MSLTKGTLYLNFLKQVKSQSEFVGGMNHVIVVTERIVLFIVCYADKMCSKERWA